MDTYILLGKTSKYIHQQDIALRHKYCWTQTAELTELLLIDLETVVQQRGYAVGCDWNLDYPQFSSGYARLLFLFDQNTSGIYPRNSLPIECKCLIGPEVTVQVSQISQEAADYLPRAFKVLLGPNYDSSATELRNLRH